MGIDLASLKSTLTPLQLQTNKQNFSNQDFFLMRSRTLYYVRQQVKVYQGNNTDWKWNLISKKILNIEKNISWSYRYLHHTVVAIAKFTSAVLWRKTAIFREVYCNIKVPPSYWALQVFIPHISIFKRGILLCFYSFGSKFTIY